MDTFVLNTDLFPMQIKEKLNVKQVSVQFYEDNDFILLLPVKEKKEFKSIRGNAKNSKLTVEKFLEMTR